MLGRLGLLAGATALAHATPKTRRKQPAGPIGIAGIVSCIAVMMIFNVMHAFTLGLFIVMPLICSVFIVIGWAQQARKKDHMISTRLEQLPTITPAPSPRAEFATVSQMRKRADQLKRTKRIVELLSVGCPLCGSLPNVSCRVTEGRAHIVLDQRSEMYAHPERIAFAVKKGNASIEDVTAQFGGQVPDEVWQNVL